jgi:hypothetical protein
MGFVQAIGQKFFLVPYLQLQRCFFQPVRFNESLGSPGLLRRLSIALTLIPVLFLCAFPPTILIRVGIFLLFPDLFPHYTMQSFTPFAPTLLWFLFDALWASLLSCAITALIGSLFSINLGIASALALSFANGVIVHTTSDTLVDIIFGIAFGVLLGISFNSAHAIKQGGLEQATIATWIAIFFGLVIGFLAGIIVGYWAAYLYGILYPIAPDEENIAGSIVGLIAGGLTGCFSSALLGALVTRYIKDREAVLAVGIRITLAVSLAFSLALGIPAGDLGFHHDTFVNGIVYGLEQEGIVFVAFLIFFQLSYYRLPLYPFSAYSTMSAYMLSQRQRQPALYSLRHSALHWDECTFLPLPYLKELLLLAAEQSLSETLEEIHFIITQRLQQSWAAKITAYELGLRDLEQRMGLRDISLAHQKLDLLVPSVVRELSPTASKVFRVLDDASRAAASYQTQKNREDRQRALGQMIEYLQALHSSNSFSYLTLNQMLGAVVRSWIMLAEQGKDTLGTTSGALSIENPYVPGQSLDLRNPLFVGRNDVVQKLSQAFHKPQRPTFLLFGERRMGKSSIIKQLPVLLGPGYVPVFYDLQQSGLLANAAAFFGNVAIGITRQMRDRGMLVPPLDRVWLDSIQQAQGELPVYDHFDRWLGLVEELLEREERVLLLAFDEFEQLSDPESTGNLNLKLLFNWFRSVIQNRSRLALLFSGAKMVGDMGRSSAGYFVNVERIKVSFLHKDDARDLIVRPVPSIFSEEVASEVMRVTSCHPFLIQAVCKQVIELLNYTSREQATLQDVIQAQHEVFENWPAYFWDLWDNCDEQQAACLRALLALTQADSSQIIQYTTQLPESILTALKKLLLRDMVLLDQDLYRIAVPMFASWMIQNL